jgi:lysophospholipase L1-like esterase
MALAQILFRRGTAAEWTAANPILAAGEPGLDTTANRWKLGDGSTPFLALPWAVLSDTDVARLEAAAEALVGAVTPTDAVMATVAANPDSQFATQQRTAIAGFDVPAYAGARSNRYEPTLGRYNFKQSNLRRFTNALAAAAAGTGFARINCIGDSITLGFPGNGSGTYEQVSWVHALADKFGELYGPAGTGVVWANGGETDARWVTSGTWAAATAGYGPFGDRFLVASSAGAQKEFTPRQQVDRFRVYFWGYAGSGNLALSVDGGAVTNVATASSPGALQHADISAGSMGIHTLRLVAAAGVLIAGAEGLAGPSGVRVSRIGKGGAKAGDFVNPTGTTAAGVGDSLHSALDMIPPDLTVIAFGHNEYIQHESVATFKTNVQAIITRAKSFGDVLLLTQVPNGTTSWTPSQDAYNDAVYDLADENGVALLDVADLWGPYAANNTSLMYDDPTHPSPEGYKAIASAIFDALPSGSGSGLGTRVASLEGDRLLTFGFPHTIDPRTVSGNRAVDAANKCVFGRVREGGKVSKIGLFVGAASGAISVAVYRNTGVGRGAAPGERVATSGAVACPAVGYAEVALDSAVWVRPGDWIALSVDNVTATFANASSLGGYALPLGIGTAQATAHPAPASATPSGGYGGVPCLIGVP